MAQKTNHDWKTVFLHDYCTHWLLTFKHHKHLTQRVVNYNCCMSIRQYKACTCCVWVFKIFLPPLSEYFIAHGILLLPFFVLLIFTMFYPNGNSNFCTLFHKRTSKNNKCRQTLFVKYSVLNSIDNCHLFSLFMRRKHALVFGGY